MLTQEKDADIRTLRVSPNEDFGDMFDRAQQTQQDGTHEDPMFFIGTLDPNNLCNPSCPTCGPESVVSGTVMLKKHGTTMNHNC